MKSVNLIPAPRRVAKLRRIHLRRCAVACAGWAILSAAAVASSHALWRNPEDMQAWGPAAGGYGVYLRK